MTYDNTCYAEAAGATIASKGVCPEVPTMPTATAATVSACPMNYEPVCGADGMTYGCVELLAEDCGMLLIVVGSGTPTGCVALFWVLETEGYAVGCTKLLVVGCEDSLTLKPAVKTNMSMPRGWSSSTSGASSRIRGPCWRSRRHSCNMYIGLLRNIDIGKWVLRARPPVVM